MILSKDQKKSLEEATKPLIKWLNDNCHPHVVVITDCVRSGLYEGINSFVTEEYLKD